MYGPTLRALAAYLLVLQHIPVARTAALIADLTRARPSTGWISSVLTHTAEVLSDVQKLIKTLVTRAPVIHVDETSSNINGARWWLHVAGTEKLTAYHLHRSRGRCAVAEFAILPDYRGTVVHDALNVYDAYPQASHGLCGAHLARELTAAAEAHPDRDWPQQALHALHGLNTAAHDARDQQLSAIPPEIAEPLLTSWRHALLVGLAEQACSRAPPIQIPQPAGALARPRRPGTAVRARPERALHQQRPRRASRRHHRQPMDTAATPRDLNGYVVSSSLPPTANLTVQVSGLAIRFSLISHDRVMPYGGSASMTDDLWSEPDKGDLYGTAAPPLTPSLPQKDPVLPWYQSRIKEEQSRRERRDARFVMLGGLGGLALGVIAAIVLAATVPEVLGSPWIQMLVVLTGVIAGILVGLIPGLRFHAGRLR